MQNANAKINYELKTKLGNQVNGKNTIRSNILFYMIIQRNASRGHPKHQGQSERY